MAKTTRSRRKPSSRPARPAAGSVTSEGAELIVVTKAAAAIRVRRGGAEVASLAGADARGLKAILSDRFRLTPLFGSEDRVIARAAVVAAETGRTGPDLSVFYLVDAPGANLDALAAELRGHEAVDAAYVKPRSEPPLENDIPPDAGDAPPVSPDFTASQVYLGAAPGGIEALWAHGRPGGKGNGVRIIDVEGAWRYSHEDLMQVQGGVVGGTQSTDIGWRNHGTAVIGVFGGDDNSTGVIGISPAANTRSIAIFGAGQGSAKAIRDAADLLSAGDIILIELHRPGPRHAFANRDDQLGYIAVEWWEDDWAAIKYATNKGVIVVEAGGNGAENLDDGIYAVRPAGFPTSWTNPFNRANRDSGAILVGAGAPPPGTHGRDNGPDRSRLDFSNYGASVDVQGWGREVTTTGYGNLQGGSNEDVWYTDRFSGTSSASPVVVGAVACVQGNRLARGLAVYTPAQMRDRFRTTGSVQTDAPGRPATQRIGNRPNLKDIIGFVKPFKEVVKEIKEKDLAKETVKETKEFKAEKVEVKEVKEVEKRTEKQSVQEKRFDKNLEKRVEKPLEKQVEGVGPVAGGDLEARLGALEAAVSQIAHFIGGELRPDLGQGALSNEDDLRATERRLQAQADAAKHAKDTKDIEKLGEQ